MSLHFNQSNIDDPVEHVFMEEARIEVAFNLESYVPIVLPTNIYKCSYESNRMLIYQPHPAILPSHKFDTMDITMLVKKELNRMTRVGLRCRIVKFLNNYKVSERITDNFLLIEYYKPMRKVNLRTTYRLRASYLFNVEGKLHYNDMSYESGKHFTVWDISVTGAGLLVPKSVVRKENPLLKVTLNDTMNLNLKLTQADSGNRPQKISTRIEITRKVMSFNATNGFIGIRFLELSPENQESLFQFIHEAQLNEIRNIKHL